MKPQTLSPNFYKMRLIGKTGKFLFIPFVVLELLVITSTARASVIRREIIDQRHATTALESTTETVAIINVTSTTTTTPAAIVTDTPSPIARVTSNEIANRISSSRNDKSFTIEATTPSAAATENAPSLINNEREAVEEKTTAGPHRGVEGSTTEKIEDEEAKTKDLTKEKNVPQNSTDLAKESTTEAEQSTSTKLPLFDFNRYTFDDTEVTQKPVENNTTKITDYEKHFEQLFLTTPDFEQISQTTQQSFLGEGGNDEKDVDKRFDYTTEPSAIIETTTIKITSQRLIDAADPHEIKSNSTVEQNTTVLVNESEIESTNYDIATNEIRNSTTRTNGDKRAKFMNMTIPDRPEIWALASMKHVEHTKDKLGNLVNTTVTNTIPDKNGTSATKLLADWSQVFKDIDFKNKTTNNSPNSIENTLETENKIPSENVHEQMEQENQVVSIIIDPPTSLSTGTVKPSTMSMSTISSIDLNEKGKTTSSIDKNQVDDVELVQKKYVAEGTLNELKELPKSTASSPVAAAIKPTEETIISKDETATTKDESTTPKDESTTLKEEKTETGQVEVTTTAAPSTTTNHPDVIETTAPETKLNKDFSSSVSIVSTTDETKAQTETTEDIALLTIAELSTVPTSSITNISRETTTEIVSSSTFSVESSTTESTIQEESTPTEADFPSSTPATESTQKSGSLDFQELASTRIFDISTTTTRTENKTPENAEIQARTPFNVEFLESTTGSGSLEFTSTSEIDSSSFTSGTSSETNFFDFSLESTTTSIDNSLESTKMATVAVSQTTETLPDTSVDSNSIEQLSTSTTTVESISVNRHPKIAETTTTKNMDDGQTTDHDPQVGAPISPDEGDPNDTDYNVIIAISVSVVGIIALVLLVGFLYVMRKRQKNLTYGQRCRPVSLDAYSLDNVSVYNSVRRKGALRPSKRSYGNVAFDDPSLKHNVLNVQDLAKFVDKKMTIYEEYKDVPQIIARADEVPQGCEDKNRYANVIPLPETRVILQRQNGDEKTEYINANYVRGPKDSPNYYIACQAPLESTTADFWRMIWEQNSRVIIMATDLVENGKEKCAEYLPPSITLDNHIAYGDFQITLKSREVKEKYAVSTLHVKNIPLNSWREITHFWYQWPETGVPNDEAGVIAMLLEARSCLKMSAVDHIDEDKKSSEDVAQTNGNLEKTKSSSKNQGPLTVHCSPGTGRTGTIVACDIALRSLETPKRSVDIPQIVYYVRRGRASAVQTKEQYEFIYKVAHMYATKISGPINDN